MTDTFQWRLHNCVHKKDKKKKSLIGGQLLQSLCKSERSVAGKRYIFNERSFLRLWKHCFNFTDDSLSNFLCVMIMHKSGNCSNADKCNHSTIVAERWYAFPFNSSALIVKNDKKKYWFRESSRGGGMHFERWQRIPMRSHHKHCHLRRNGDLARH